MGMTRKDYVALAAAVDSAKGIIMEDDERSVERFNQMVGLRITAKAIANTLAEDNPRFDRERFLTACGLDTPKASVRPFGAWQAELDN